MFSFISLSVSISNDWFEILNQAKLKIIFSILKLFLKVLNVRSLSSVLPLTVMLPVTAFFEGNIISL